MKSTILQNPFLNIENVFSKRYKVVDGYIYLSNRKEEEYEDEEE